MAMLSLLLCLRPLRPLFLGQARRPHCTLVAYDKATSVAEQDHHKKVLCKI
ncbi:hypothetical protein AAZX31_17G068400 [Glycine max]|nr:hypothetical protein GLYMA_17G070351v4 [Glycine max]KAH1117216.1 hypothetical protein GYH30_046507 [Glycine max]